MARRASSRLTQATIKALVAKGRPARHADGGNLYLFINGPDVARWTVRYKLAGRVREMSLGPYPDVGLAEARVAAEAARRQLRDGLDPIEARRSAKAEAQGTLSFRDVAGRYIEAHRAGWRNAKHAAQWPATLEAYAYPEFGDMAVAAVDTGAVMRVLEPIWQKIPETASRLRGRMEAVLDYAAARGWRQGDNPARWRGHLANLLPPRDKVQRVQHHPALPWAEIGAFVAALRGQAGVGALAVRFAILTAARSGEVRGARWAEIDMQADIWTVPGERMKAGREHRVPLSDAALDVLREAVELRESNAADALVFPGAKRGAPLSDMSLTAVLRRMKRDDLTVHGFRSTFRDWCAEATGYPRDAAEMALAHTIGDKVEAAYRRGDLFEKRRRLMDEWATFCSRIATPADNVRSLRRA